MITNKIVLIYFCIGACLPRCDFSQLLHLNDLAEHYQLHQIEAISSNQDFSIWDFIYLHFISGDEHHHDNSNEHDNLPLQKISTSIVLYAQGISNLVSRSNLDTSSKFIAFNQTLTIDFITSVFHPPSFLNCRES